MAKKINAFAYVECSAKRKKGVREVFETTTIFPNSHSLFPFYQCNDTPQSSTSGTLCLRLCHTHTDFEGYSTPRFVNQLEQCCGDAAVHTCYQFNQPCIAPPFVLHTFGEVNLIVGETSVDQTINQDQPSV